MLLLLFASRSYVYTRQPSPKLKLVLTNLLKTLEMSCVTNSKWQKVVGFSKTNTTNKIVSLAAPVILLPTSDTPPHQWYSSPPVILLPTSDTILGTFSRKLLPIVASWHSDSSYRNNIPLLKVEDRTQSPQPSYYPVLTSDIKSLIIVVVIIAYQLAILGGEPQIIDLSFALLAYCCGYISLVAIM